MPELKGLDYLRMKQRKKAVRVKTRYIFYEMKNRMVDFNISTPDSLRHINYTLGWCAKAVDALADRLVFRGMNNDAYGMNELFNLNNRDVLFDSAILSALIGSCAFIYIAPEGYFPRMRVIDGANATGILDPITNLLTEGYAILERDEYGNPSIEAYFTPSETQIHTRNSIAHYRNPAPYPLLVPIIHRPDAKREFGHSRISRACMDLTESAVRTIKRSEISAEFYSFPQRYVVGTDPQMQMDAWQSAVSFFLNIPKDYDGDTPTVGAFTQQAMDPHITQLRTFASLFAGETGLTLDDLGFATENPSSAEAIKAAHENLRLAARKAQRDFGTGFLNAGYLALCVKDDFPYQRYQIYQTTPTWEPIFEPDAAMLSGIGDGAIKINQAVPDYFTKDTLELLTGIRGGA